MAAVIDILSSDDEDEPVVSTSSKRLAGILQTTVAERPTCKKEWDVVQRTCPGVEERHMNNGGASTSGQGQGSSSLLVQIKGKMREDVRLAQPSQNDNSMCRQFWQAGNYEVQPPKRRRIVQGAMDHVRVHPKFLHSNATSHKWALGAIAELLDNSIDEIVNGATYVRVDKIANPRDETACLLIQDDGGGMSPDDIRRCMSLGYSQKNSNTTIGQYGNGFKTSTMRLGADVIVLTRKASESGFVTQSAGLLSYTFLRKTGHEDIVVPMVDYKLSGDGSNTAAFLRTSMDDWLSNLATITRWSPYRSQDELLKQFDDIGGHGTKVIVYNLWHNDDGLLELDFDTNQHDIQLRVGTKEKTKQPNLPTMLVEEHISSTYRLSLRVYASILYLNMPQNFRIILRGKVVDYYSIASDLKFPESIMYKPQIGASNKDVSVVTIIGFTKEAPMINVHGFNVYHKNRLIMPFWKVLQESSSRGRGIVGVLEANFIEPAHDKQGFERTAVFMRLENRLKAMTIEYWNLHSHMVGYKGVTKQPRPVPNLIHPNFTAVPNPVQQHITSTAGPLNAQIALPTSPTSSSSRMENDEGSHPLSTSTSGPATPDGVLAKGKGGVEEGGRQQNNPEQAMAGGQVATVTMSPENGALLAEVLEQNTSLRQRCVDYERHVKHWELKFVVNEQRERERELKIAALEKELMEYKLKCMNMEQLPRFPPNAATVNQGIQYQLQPLEICKAEFE